MYPKEYKIMNLLVSENRELYLREIHKLTKLSLKSVQNSLKNLEQERILISKIVGKNKFFRINKDEPKTRYALEIGELIKTIEFLNKNTLLKSFAEKIQNSEADAVIIFGSFAKNTQKKDSDLDILILSEKEIGLPAHLSPKKIHSIVMNKEEFLKNTKESVLISEIFINHIILKNSNLFINSIWEWLK
jgi:predicted nucleotidyltransferase